MYNPEERVEAYKKNAKEAASKSNKKKSKEMEANLDERIAEYAAERMSTKAVMTELRGKLKHRAEEKKIAAKQEADRKKGEKIVAALAKAGKEIEAEKTKQSLAETRKALEKLDGNEYASYEVSDGKEAEVAVKSEQKKDTNKNVIRRASKEITLELEPVVPEEINEAEKSKEEEPYEAFEVSETEKDLPKKTVTSETGGVVSGEINNEYELGKKRVVNKNVIKRPSNEAAKVKEMEMGRQQAKESRAEEAQAAYVKAYREYDSRFTKNKSDDLIAVSKPPFLTFSSAGRELKRLYVVMENSRKNREGEDDGRKIKENVGKIREEFKNRELAVGPKVIDESMRAEDLDKASEYLAHKKFAPKEGDAEKYKKQTREKRLWEKSTLDWVREDLLIAYKEIGVKVTDENSEEVLAKKPPFSYVFSAKGRKVRDLYDGYIKKLQEKEIEGQ